METITDYLEHFSGKLFQHITSTAMTETDGKAAGTTQLLFTFLFSLQLQWRSVVYVNGYILFRLT